MILCLSYGNHDNGAYGTVFFDKKNNIAIKVFKRKELYRDEQIKRTFESEVSAYNIAMNDDVLKKYIPKFYGKFEKIERILDEYEIDISSEYFLNLAYTMEYIPNKFVKNNAYCVDTSHRDLVFELFKNGGISYLGDSSVYVDDRGKVIYIIDFAENDHSP